MAWRGRRLRCDTSQGPSRLFPGRTGKNPPPAVRRAFHDPGPRKGHISAGNVHLLCHFPKDPHCEICRRAKATNRPARRHPEMKDGRETPEDAACEQLVPRRFGDLITADHIILGERQASRAGDTVALVCFDRATCAIGVYPASPNTTDNTVAALLNFVPPTVTPKLFYTDCSAELEAAARTLTWRHDTSTPYRPTTNSVAERAVRTAVDGTRAVLLASGLEHCWWREACQCFAALYNVSHVGPSGHTPYFLVRGEEFPGYIVPFGAQIRYKPSGDMAKNQEKFCDRTRLGIFMGYHMNAGLKLSRGY